MIRRVAGVKKNRPFRGPTPEGVIQTLDVGAAHAPWVSRQKQRFSGRRYAVVDPYYSEVNPSLGRDLRGRGLLVFPTTLKQAIEKMKKEGLKTRHINFDMPAFGLDYGKIGVLSKIQRGEYKTTDLYGFDFLFAQLPHILLPGGRIFIKSESLRLLDEIEKKAHRHGLNVRPRKRLPNRNEVLRTFKMQTIDKPIFELRITYAPKKATRGENGQN